MKLYKNQTTFNFGKPTLVDIILGNLLALKKEGFRNLKVQAVVAGSVGAILARLISHFSYAEELDPYITAILFETITTAAFVLLHQKMGGISWIKSTYMAAIAAVFGFIFTAATGII